MIRKKPVAVIGAAVLITALGVTPALAADEAEQLDNGTFDTSSAPWWATGGAPITLTDGRACVDVPGGTTNRWDFAFGQNDVSLVEGETYRFSFAASGTPEGHVVRAITGQSVAPYATYFESSPVLGAAAADYSFTFTQGATTDEGQVAFQLGGSADPYTFCVDNVSLLGGVAPEVYKPDTGPRVRVNQVAYLPNGPKNATVVTESTTALPWELKNSHGTVVARGKSTPRGVDPTSGQNIASIDFSRYTAKGKGFTLVTDGEISRPFDIGGAIYEQLRTDALKMFYTQRSGIAIDDALRPGYGRPAGHVNVAPNQGDSNVPCQPGVCDYTLDVTGGWYDAGDHGKYVVNGGISVWQLLNQYERSTLVAGARTGKLGDSTLNIPESGNKVPDILDETRWELEFLFKMQVPAGKPFAGMAHHKVHDENWTGLPLLPNLDPQKRELHPVSTAATLNLAATAAQAARVYKRFDPAFAAHALTVAKTAYDAALANPDKLASAADGTGGGTYDDKIVADDFYWAAAELFLTTGAKTYSDAVVASEYNTSDLYGTAAFDWASTAAAGRLDLALVPSKLPGRNQVRKSIVAAAEKYLAAQKANGYGLPYAPPNNLFDWGSNSQVLNNLVVVASAYDISGRKAFRDGVLEGFDYILGRNALNQSYVTGYGTVFSQNQHSRWYSHQLDPNLPNPPRGTLSGGPNSGIQDPVAADKLKGCTGQFCYIDDIQSWSTNELTINWNAPLAWVSSFVADQGQG